MKYDFWALLFLSTIGLAQDKKFKNEYAYKADSSVYIFEKYVSTKRTKHCKSILINQKNEVVIGEVWEKSWTVEKQELLKTGVLFIVENQSISQSVVKDEVGAFILGTKKGVWLGPYESSYGQFRFIEITFNSAVLSNDSYDSVSKTYNWRVFSKRNGSVQYLNKLIQDLLYYYKTGKGKLNLLERKLRKYKAKKIKPDTFLDATETKKKINLAPFGQSYFIVDMEENIILLKLEKRNTREEYVYYNEYIFK